MRIVIVGAGQLGRALATDLLHAGNDVHVLDADSEALGRLSHDFEGEQLYMFHCHILEHETAMMLNVKVI